MIQQCKPAKRHILLLICFWFTHCQSEYGAIRSANHSNTAGSRMWDIPIPAVSYFSGFSPPNDKKKWNKALENAQQGKPILLKQVLKTITCPGDILDGEKKFKWIHNLVDIFASRDVGLVKSIQIKNYTGHRAPIVALGYREFDVKGVETRALPFPASAVVKIFKNKKLSLPKKIVALGMMDENWGWLSTHFLNRTATWALSLDKSLGHHTNISLNDQLAPFLDNPKLLMLLVNQHHNVGSTLMVG